MISVAIKLGNIHPTSLSNEPRLCWLDFLYHHLLWLCFGRGYLRCYLV